MIQDIPKVGFGTWQLTGIACKEAVITALEHGYNHIDTAYIYQNHKEIGKAIQESLVKREDIFLTSKIWYDNMEYNQVIMQANQILEELQTEYLDLLLIHWPNKHVPMKETFDALTELVQSGKVKHIGVSNFTITHLKEAMNVSSIPIYCNQVEFHPYFFQQEMLAFCNEHKIKLVAYSPLGSGNDLKDEYLKKMAHEKGVTVAQLILAWELDKGIIVIPKASRAKRILENRECEHILLTKQETDFIDSCNLNQRYCNPDFAEFDK